MNYSNVYAVCYDNLYVFNSKEDAKNFFGDCYYMSEGAEHERYASILVDLNFSNLGKDNVSTYCREISIQSSENKFLNVELESDFSIDDAIKYYEEKLQPILEVSKNYDVDFNRKIPFDNFGSDEDSYSKNSFSNYYQDLCEKLDIKFDNIYTEEESDGKYKLFVNDIDFKLTAWDSLNSVLDNLCFMTVLDKTNNLKKENENISEETEMEI